MSKHIIVIRQVLKKNKVDAVLISSVAHISYLTDYSNFSTEEREAYLLITKKKNYIFTDGRYSEAVKKQVKDFELVELGRGVSFLELLKGITKEQKIRTVGIEESDLKVSEHKLFTRAISKVKGVDIESLRVIKESWEIRNIEKACWLGDQTFEHILKIITPGIKEVEVAWEMEKFIKSKGGKLSFETIVAFGKNSSVPHHHTGQTKLKGSKGEFILLDFGTKINGYCSDMTRTIFYGTPSEKQKKMHQAVLGAQKEAGEYIKKHITSRVKASEVDLVAREYIRKQGFPDFSHSLGHGIGLQVHELPHLSPRTNNLLQEGMVFSIEPGIYIPGFGGVRIEDLYAIEKGKLKELTKARKSLITL